MSGSQLPPPGSQLPPNGKGVISDVISVVKDDELKNRRKSETETFNLFQAMMGSEFDGWYVYVRKQYPDTNPLPAFVERFGAETIRRAWATIQRVPPLLTADHKPHSSGYRLFDFLTDKLRADRECHDLCELHTRAVRADEARRAVAPALRVGDLVEIREHGTCTVSWVAGSCFGVDEDPDTFMLDQVVKLPPTAQLLMVGCAA